MSKTVTITEALADLKVIDKRIEAKRTFVGNNILRHAQLKDPLEKEGGSWEAIKRERQAIGDLEAQKIAIRRAIVSANATNSISVNGTTRSIADWLTWKRDVAPSQRGFLAQIQSGINTNRQNALRQGAKVTKEGEAGPTDIVVNLNEQELAKEQEELEATLGTLDGQLSLKNATITVTY